MKPILVMSCAIALATSAFAQQQPEVQVQPPSLDGSRPLEKQTQAAVVRDYLEAWQKFRAALDQNQAAYLNQDFVGTAREKLGATIAAQAKLGIHAHYQDQSHNLQIVFYSPDGLSLELIDNVEYNEQVVDHDKILATQHVKARYLAVLTPAEVRWKVRVFQVDPQ
jgi:hypothetical protein